MTITQDRLREVVSYDAKTGAFAWRTTLSERAIAGAAAGCVCKTNGYRLIRIDWVLYRAHRLAWLYVHGHWPQNDLDHINGDRSDNRLSNLRAATRAENLQNLLRAKRNGSSGFLGAHRWRHKWRARIQINGIGRHLGTFDSPELAHQAYLAAKAQLHPFQTLT